jgi:flagellar assembly protein FliH
MALRLIKKGDQLAARARALSFAETQAPANGTAPQDPTWCGVVAGGDAGSGLSASREKRQGPLDAARFEKLAYDEGFRQGETAGLETAEKKVEALTRRYGDAIAEVLELKAALYSQVEKDVVRLALEVAKKIVHREIRADREIIQTLVKVALSHAAVKSAATIRLHPTDYSYILEHRAELGSSPEEEKEIVLVADKSIERGGCLIQTACGDIDARIDEEFREIEQAFFAEREP